MIAACLLSMSIWLAAAGQAGGTCTGPRCYPPATPHPAVVRVVNETAGMQSLGSGTLVAGDGRTGTVLTCAHLFREGSERVSVTFAGGSPLAAELIGIDAAWDLAALRIAAPHVTPVKIAQQPPVPGEPLRSCGYGPDGRYWCNAGRALGYSRRSPAGTFETLELSGTAREGDSGGPVFNARGELAAVIWGTDRRSVSATYSGRVRKFLEAVAAIQPPPISAGEADGKADPPPGDAAAAIGGRLDALAAKLEAMHGEFDGQRRIAADRMEKFERALAAVEAIGGRIGEVESAIEPGRLRALIRDALAGAAAGHGAGLLERALPVLLAALGWTAPPSIALIIAARVIGALVRRRIRQRLDRAPPSASPAPAKGMQDDYAEQLARVFSLSGRSALADATLGREYDEQLRQAETSSDAVLAAWARKIRDRVARKFHRVHGLAPAPADGVEN